MDTGTFRGIITFLVLVSFLGITWWAYSKRRKPDFEEAANLPFADDDEPSQDASAPAREPDTRDAESRTDKGDKNT
ncbi:cbb3-type cytochrome c oxidase subunit 3 [Franzmannia qiaohouensis]|uniref:Cbb3-type cytochrome c oxidase subunit 3 n=1 Tax=Franzmannia qiaohouensis TaxID=1329370 RepID=A0ABU1HB34_9GAMM|nr:cbb3-type cytochrome c oxidase subunit 3 [Halomonas qiaohouensis]MDR5904675.1 cbb3-type cytochrome c oxidase subunit 3 [Halomonas qiaohouensis]